MPPGSLIRNMLKRHKKNKALWPVCFNDGTSGNNLCQKINSFHATGLLFYTLKTSENFSISVGIEKDQWDERDWWQMWYLQLKRNMLHVTFKNFGVKPWTYSNIKMGQSPSHIDFFLRKLRRIFRIYSRVLISIYNTTAKTLPNVSDAPLR